MIKKIANKIKIQKYIKRMFPNESLLMKGVHPTTCTENSILYFTVHRCASRYVLSILNKIISQSEMTCIDMEGYFWRGGETRLSSQEIYKKSGYIYGPFYGLDKEELTFTIPNSEDFKVLLMLRDPRDVLTSYYFHHAYDPYDNPAQTEFILARSRDAASKKIDEWVLEKAPIFKARYQEYLNKFIDKPNVLFLKYEEMVDDFNSWLNRLMLFTNLSIPNEIVDSIIKNADFNVGKEDVKSHKRQVTPGDHKRKLNKETIVALNSQFSEILDALEYDS